ncbi:Tpp1 [Kluyveromyces lactis]|nr:Tpp1 [Kluyveromyces lactis]
MSQFTHKLTILPHIIKWVPKDPAPVRKVISFDLDHTVIKPNKGRFSRTSDDWIFMKYGQTEVLAKLSAQMKETPDFHIVFFSNQGGVVSEPRTSKSCVKHVDKICKVLKYISENDSQLCDRIWIYCATKKPASLFGGSKPASTAHANKVVKNIISGQKKRINGEMVTPEMFDNVRKPNRGMFDEFLKDSDEQSDSIELLFYCGDAAGRPNDFSDSDKEFAKLLGVPFKVPEEYFI